MKTLLFAGILILAGCTTNTPPQTAQKPVPNPMKQTHTSAELNKTGRQTVGEQLEQVDPAISVTHR